VKVSTWLSPNCWCIYSSSNTGEGELLGRQESSPCECYTKSQLLLFSNEMARLNIRVSAVAVGAAATAQAAVAPMTDDQLAYAF
jgi:hypothetical protein